MKRYLTLALLPLLAGCGVSRIVTVSPSYGSVAPYSTTVTALRPRTVTTTTTPSVYATSSDISLHLDLQAVGAAFAQSSTVQEFENLLNNSSYMLSNLDLNGDGYVDYLRVLETLDGRNHIFLIQAVLDTNVYQDVATIVAEMPTYGNPYVQVIGAPYIYGPKYIIEPVYITRPLIFDYLLRPSYMPWHSPWTWGHFPANYRRPAHIYVNHYQAYVDVYMRNHHYCHSFSYAVDYHYPAYERVINVYMRNDYGIQHPERSFTVRNANLPSSASAGVTRAANARDIREARAAVSSTTINSRSANGSSTAATPSRSASTSSTTATPSRSASTSSTAATPSRSASTSSTTATPSRSASTSSTTATPSRSASTSSSTATPSRSASVQNQTTVRSRVSSSGSSNTRIKTVTPSGSESTSNRAATSSTSGSRAASTSSSSSTSSRAASTSSSTSGSRASAVSGAPTSRR